MLSHFDAAASAVISSMLVMPLLFLEQVNRRNFDEGFPLPLFVILWLLPLVFSLILFPILRSARAGSMLASGRLGLLLKFSLLILVSSLWIGIALDQMPCFLGVPNCD